MTDVTERLDLAGDALHAAWRLDRSRRRVARGAAATIACTVLVLGAGAAIAGSLFKSAADEETGLVEGYRLFAGSSPRCASTSSTSFRCVLARTPTGETFYGPGGKQLFRGFLGLKAETVDTTRHVDGGCVSVRDDGRTWDCYLGQSAVDHGVVRARLLGTYLPEAPTA